MSFKIVSYEKFASYQQYVLRSIGLVNADYQKMKQELEGQKAYFDQCYRACSQLCESLFKWTSYVRGANPKKVAPFHQHVFESHLTELLDRSRALMARWTITRAIDCPTVTEFLNVIVQLKISSDVAQLLDGFQQFASVKDAYLLPTPEVINVSLTRDPAVHHFVMSVYPAFKRLQVPKTEATQVAVLSSAPTEEEISIPEKLKGTIQPIEVMSVQKTVTLLTEFENWIFLRKLTNKDIADMMTLLAKQIK
jgi:hypothetical protein